MLLVCPKPLVTNWQREFNLWAPETPLTVIEGDQAKRHWQWRLPNCPVKIANYELLQRDRDMLHAATATCTSTWSCSTNRNGSRTAPAPPAQIVRSISRSRNWALTGTPVENSPEDLVGIFEFLAPGYLSSDMKPRRMGKPASDYVLRRTKDTGADRDAAQNFSRRRRHAHARAATRRYRLAEDEGVLRLTEMGDGATIQHVFELVLRLKQICNFDPATGDSTKLERLDADLEEIAASGQKAIVFSQWVHTLDELDQRLKRFHPLAYHGGDPLAQARRHHPRIQGQPRPASCC